MSEHRMSLPAECEIAPVSGVQVLASRRIPTSTPELRRRIDGRVAGVHAFSTGWTGTYDPVISCGPAT